MLLDALRVAQTSNVEKMTDVEFLAKQGHALMAKLVTTELAIALLVVRTVIAERQDTQEIRFAEGMISIETI